MSMRITRGQPPEGQTDELIRKWKAFWPERMRAVPGFQHAHFGIDRATGATATVSVFSDKPDDALMERNLREFRDMLGRSDSGQGPEITSYEVVAEV